MRTPPRMPAILFAVALCAPAAASAQQTGGPPPAPTVDVSAPLAKRVTNWDEFTGRFEASEQVEIRARVSGFIDAVHFRDGEAVDKGARLFTIDPRPYALAVDAARAELVRAQAQVDLARNEVERAEGLTQNRTITARDVDQRRTNLDSALGSQQAAQASLKTAELNLEWTVVRAPMAGRISNHRVDVGNLISGGQTGSTLLTTIVAASPINFVFDTSEADYLRYARLMRTLRRSSDRDAPVAEVRLSDEREWGRRGRIDFVDNSLNPRSGTIRMRAMFDNADQFLTPGVFGRLRLNSGEDEALLIPDTAIVSDQADKVVMTVGAGDKVVPKAVRLGQLVEGLRVVRSGLSKDDRVIVGGLANPMVRPGAPVTPKAGEIRTASAD